MQEIDVGELAAKRNAGAPLYLLDVRQRWETELASLPGSQAIPLDQLPGRLGEIKPPAGALIVVYCHHGIRSQLGAELLAAAGISPVASLRGGIDAWSLHVDPSLPRY